MEAGPSCAGSSQEARGRLGTHVRSRSAASPPAAQLLDAFVAEIAVLLPDGFDVTRSGPLDVEEMAPPAGDFLVLFDDDSGEAVACGGLRALGEGRLEIKRMYVTPSFRRGGYGRQLLAALEHRARELDAKEVLLDTHEVLTLAITMYQRAGYEEVEPYNENPYASKWFKKTLS